MAWQSDGQLLSFSVTHHEHDAGTNEGEQNGCRQRLEGYLSCQQRLALAVA